MKGRRFKTAFILGAGLGTRLRPLTERCPKPLLPIAGRPMITYAMDHLARAGVDRFIINTYHSPDVYAESFPDDQWKGIPIHFRHERVLLDTAGGLKNIEDLLVEDEAILCYNGDVLSDLPLQELIDSHEQNRPEATLALRTCGPLLNVDVDEEGRICDMRGALGKRGAAACLFTGIYTVETSILSRIEKGKIESVVDLFLRRIIERPASIRGVVIDKGRWHDIGSIEVYNKLNAGPDGIAGEEK